MLKTCRQVAGVRGLIDRLIGLLDARREGERPIGFALLQAHPASSAPASCFFWWQLNYRIYMVHKHHRPAHSCLTNTIAVCSREMPIKYPATKGGGHRSPSDEQSFSPRSWPVDQWRVVERVEPNKTATITPQYRCLYGNV